VPTTSFTREVDTAKALDLLIHDLRAPLSVAHGYLRLLKENRLSSAEERDRALGQTIDALTRMSCLCSDASAYANPAVSTTLPAASTSLSQFTGDVRRACESSCAAGFALDLLSGGARSIRATSLQRLAEALAVILCATKRAAGNVPVAVTASVVDDEARFLMGGEEDRTRLATQAATFDPWRGGHTIALPLACRTVAEAGGRIWTLADVRGAIGLALPLEDSAS
jgi:hypothetical protein